MANALRLGIIGLGRGFMLTLPALKADSRVALAGAFDLRREARERFADEFGAPAFDTLDALLYSPVIDAVYIA
ncbi:Gfo/Idh/MocA family oxidoreductase, partial [Acinetobacter baumannii]